MSIKQQHLGDIAPGTNLLLIPFATVVIVVLLFASTVALDVAAARGRLTLPGWLSVGNIDDARAVLGAILGGVSTVLALIFSVSLLVFSTAAVQFGPRLMQRFLRDRMMQLTLGLFTATFVHALLTLILVRQGGHAAFVPQLTVLMTCVLVLLSFGLLLVYNHRVARSIQMNNLLPQIVEDLQSALSELSGSRAQRLSQAGAAGRSRGQDAADLATVSASCGTEGGVVHAALGGFIQKIDFLRLLRAAERADAVVRLCFRPGQFVGEGDVLAQVLPAARVDRLATVILGAVQIGRNRTLEQDLEFAIAQLVEISLRALSPAVNDTYTGLYCIDWLGDAVRKLAAVPESDGAWRNMVGAVRLISPPVTFSRFVKGAFDMLREASSGNPAVEIRLLQTWASLGPHLKTETQRQIVLAQAAALWDTASQESMAATDREEISDAHQRVVEALRA